MKIPCYAGFSQSPPGRSLLLVTCCLFGCLLSSCAPERPQQLHEFTGLTMGTSWSVLVNAGELPDSRRQLQAEFNAILNRVNMAMSSYLPESELSRINASDSAGWLTLSAPLLHVLQAAQQINRLTQGAFDITVGPLVELWGFGPERDFMVPADQQVNTALRLVGQGKLQLDVTAPALKKAHGGVYIDLSAIAKGYGVDEIAGYLDLLQLDNYLVEIGGEIRARGVNDENRPWQIGIEQPAAGQRAVRKVIKLENMAMATSGDYRNYFEKGGSSYPHTIDPRTGRPVTHGLASVTVLHPSAMLADAWATGLLVLGPERGFEMAQKNGLDAYFIIRAENGLSDNFTSGFEPYFVDDGLKK